MQNLNNELAATSTSPALRPSASPKRESNPNVAIQMTDSNVNGSAAHASASAPSDALLPKMSVNVSSAGAGSAAASAADARQRKVATPGGGIRLKSIGTTTPGGSAGVKSGSKSPGTALVEAVKAANAASSAASEALTAVKFTPSNPMPMINFKTPKNVLITIIKAGMAKAQLPWWHVFILGLYAGVYIALGGLLAVVVGGGLNPGATTPITGTNIKPWPVLPKLAMGAVFPVGLMLVVFAGAELFTGNVMYISAALLSKKVQWKDAMCNFFWSYVGNFFGSVIVAYFLAYEDDIMTDYPQRAFIQNLAITKINLGWGRAVLRGIGCNFLVCLALWCGLAADDIVGKVVALWWPIFTFVTIGFEHSVANMFFVPLGLMMGVADMHDKSNFGWFIGYNLIPVTIGNIIGAAFFVSFGYWVLFESHFGEKVENLQVNPGNEKHVARDLIIADHLARGGSLPAAASFLGTSTAVVVDGPIASSVVVSTGGTPTTNGILPSQKVYGGGNLNPLSMAQPAPVV